MPLIRSSLWPDQRVQPPFGAVELDRGHQLARGLVGLWLCNEGGGARLLDSGRHARNHAAMSTVNPRVGIPSGQAVKFGPSGGSASAPDHPTIRSATSISVLARFQLKTNQDFNPYVARWAEPPRIWALTSTSGGGLRGDTSPDGGFYPGNVISSGTPMTPGSSYFAGLVHDAAASQSRLHLNGRRDTVITPSNPGVDTTTAQAVQIGGAFFGGGFRDAQAWIDLVMLYMRALSDAEVEWLYAEPYVMLRPVTRRHYAIPIPLTLSLPLSLEALQNERLLSLALPLEALQNERRLLLPLPLEALAGLGTVLPIPVEALGEPEGSLGHAFDVFRAADSPFLHFFDIMSSIPETPAVEHRFDVFEGDGSIAVSFDVFSDVLRTLRTSDDVQRPVAEVIIR